ncbi:hypothetical protein BCR35DRAFT_349157 [Leucosporidium creatinivorum]|uniref:Acetoacetate decarboxylase n=1 Tax=Leucosporidium creatinivorum TaxID=106004 RepID=A0A1Y2G5R2_9BASI|nr:hypothetical protein BCR35DRAFT_349157 [Leucosporidium creatinivorum]
MSESAIAPAPAPWLMHGSGWVFVTHTPFSKTPLPLPAGAYDPFEEGTSFDKSGDYHGGTGVVMLLRYTDCPVGPYDELIYCPGYLAFKEGAEKDGEGKDEFGMSVTRIYVSAAASVKNGRKNWGVPKHQAVFSFTPLPSDPSSTLCTVAHPTSPTTPFFRAVLRPSKLTPFSMPLNTNWVDSFLARSITGGFTAQLVQPPIPPPSTIEGAQGKAEAKGELLDWLEGSEGRLTVKPEATGWGRVTTITAEKGTEEEWGGFGDGVGFPKVAVVAGRGAELTQFVMTFPEPTRA